jgi:L-asparagine oxygenase
MPFSFVEWEAKLIVHNKFPIRDHSNFQFGSGSVEFLIHTETPFRDFSPDYVVLFCLRGDPAQGALTGLCDFRKVVERQPEANQRLFRSPKFAFETDNPIVSVEGRGLTEPRPLVFKRDGITQYEYVDDLVATSEDAGQALSQLRRDIHASRCDVNLVAGDMLLIDNSHMIHGRSAYKPRYDGNDRWLQRLLISNRLNPHLLAQSDYLIHDRCINGYPTFYHKLLDSLNPLQPGGA